MISRDVNVPTTIAQETPLDVVFFQNSSIRMAGKLAEAAIAKAKPKRKLTFWFLNRMPKTIAIMPTKTAAILAALTFLCSVISIFRTLSIKL
jgi:hypothetical protein